MKFHSEAFLTAFESGFTKLNSSQKQGLSFLIDKINADSYDTIEQVAYLLASVYWESDRTFQPVREKRAGTDQPKLRAIQDAYWHTGYYGRGYIQLTHKTNYEKFGIADNPDKALEPETSYRIASVGMKEGLFTGHKLFDYINSKSVDYINARHIVNGKDKAAVIAGIAYAIERALRSSIDEPKVVETSKPQVIEVKESEADGIVDSVSGSTLKKGGTIAVALGRSFWVRVISALTAGEYFKLSIYALIVVVVLVAIVHYRSDILRIGKKVLKKL